MKEKVVLITGGSSGMGKAMAHYFSQHGAKVVICARNEERLAETKLELETYPNQIKTYAVDVRNRADLAAMVDDVYATVGPITDLINNAAGNFLVPAEELSENGWNAVIDIVLNGTWHLSQLVGKQWIDRKEKGSIINIVATYAWTGGPGVVHSASAKAGVLAMTKTLAVEWGSRYGIRVNAIAPGPIEDTGGVDKLIQSEKAHKMALKSVPLQRFGKGEEVAKLAGYLSSDEGAYINGTCITIDGGQSIGQSGFQTGAAAFL
ncbi:2,4-dienoyl-CoA reductase (NADPH2) [Alkalihalobacillus xiaoxiensis]|uniref:2,4-dienoyl-CoA reductase (NADPH2) n=1 Tax=Shouchella xiaoxiensis TaxID=766895 RepID=A0ABS2SXP2_9BACI|nr:2,4-dienoyl-CoA reductase [Shouchella xiaoxiensis]MBM7840254.1 2,4-dienoyl-CoA reductase (NADPH2) [Shouchella xiaoxiensis]